MTFDPTDLIPQGVYFTYQLKEGLVKNEGNLDRVVRVVLGVIAVSLAVAIGGGWSVLFWIVGAVSLLTAATGFCPLYRLVGVSTCKR